MLDNSFSNSPPRAVVFDLDGLLLNTEDIYQEVGTEILARRGKKYEDDLRRKMMGQPAQAALAVMTEWHGLSDSLVDLVDESEEIFLQFVGDRLNPMPGLLDLLQAIEQAGLRKAIATSGARKYAELLLGITELAGRFEFVLTADDVTHGKPHPEVYQRAARQLNLEPAETLVLEDSQNGCLAGIAAGALTVAVPSRHSASHDFTGVAFVANTLADPRIRQTLALRA